MHAILANKNDIIKCVKAYWSFGFDNHKTSDQVQLVKTERFLALWVDQKEIEGVDLNKRDIIDKARLFYKAVCRRDSVVLGGCKVSTGWLYRFLKWKKIRNIRCTGESRSAEDVAAKDFPDVLRGIIEGGWVSSRRHLQHG